MAHRPEKHSHALRNTLLILLGFFLAYAGAIANTVEP